MADMVDIELIIDEQYTEPKVTIHADAKTEQVLKIIEAIESASEVELHSVPVYSDGKLEYISQRDIMRVRTEGRHIAIDTENRSYNVKKTLSSMEEELDGKKFIRISQSEIINIYKVKHFDVSLSGTIMIEFVNGVKTYASRRYIKSIKEFLNKEGKDNE